MRSLTAKDTICALSTAHGTGALSIVRISGARAVEVVRKLAAFLPENLESHKIYYGILKNPDNGKLLDEVLLSYFAAGRSFTGEVSFEISCHGSETIVDGILRALVSAGARPAERGEFTYRAFMNGRMDLVQAESVLALIESRSERAKDLALRQLQGGLSKVIRGLVEDTTWSLAQLEANIDFASEDIEIASHAVLHERLVGVLAKVQDLIANYQRGRIIASGLQVMFAGRPNAGKSSLLNALSESERAIVTPVPGTTRDFVEAELQIDGFRVTLVDSAGLRVTDDTVEKIGVERALERLKTADLIFYVVDSMGEWTDEDRMFVDHVPKERLIVVANKCDVGNKMAMADEHVSAKTGEGLNRLRERIRSKATADVSEDSTLVSNARHLQCLTAARTALESALPLLKNGESADLIALEIQAALQSFYDILGLTYDDQVMDRVFAEFCLGK